MTEEQMPSDFTIQYAVRYGFWIVCRWLYKNPLTLLLIGQAELVDLALSNPNWKWAVKGASGIGIIIAQIRNRGTDYTVPVKQSNVNQAAQMLASNPSTTPAPPVLPPETTK
jgi:hypothetical protein